MEGEQDAKQEVKKPKEEKDKIVLITGVSAFVGSHVAKAFLEDGTYKEIRGTVKDTDPEKLAPLKDALGADLFSKLKLY